MTTDPTNDPRGEHPRQLDDAQRDEIEAMRRRFEQDSPQAFTDDDRSRFDRITGALGTPTFPATREELTERVREAGGADSVLVAVKSLPEGSTFETYDQLLLALGIGMAGRIDVPGAPERDPGGGATSLPDRV
jgi:Protein of unknown function (DUF2795)